MKLAIIISTNERETIWNAFRLANYATGQGDEVNVFLTGQGVEYEKMSNEKFNIIEQAQKFIRSQRAKILACGTCLKLRDQESTKSCPISTLKELYALIEESDKVLTF